MKAVLITLSSAFVAVMLTACGLLQISEGTQATLRDGVAKSLTGYAEGYQPILAVYARLPTCGDPAQPPCKDKNLYRKLYALDGAVAECVMASVKALNENQTDLTGVAACLAKVDEAKFAIAKSGIASAPAVVVVPESEGDAK